MDGSQGSLGENKRWTEMPDVEVQRRGFDERTPYPIIGSAREGVWSHLGHGTLPLDHGAKQMTMRHKIMNGYLSWHRERANRVFVEMSVPSGWGHRVMFTLWGWTIFCAYPRDWTQVGDEVWL